MPLIIWFVFWWLNGFPDVQMWDVWSVSLVICVLWWLLG